MKYILNIFLSLTITYCGFSQQRKAIFVIVDGIPADLIEKLNTPGIDSITRIGGFARATVGGEKNGYSESPTISAVGYNSVLTGTWVNKHNVWDNDIEDPNYHYKTIFRFLKDQYPSKKTAIFSSWLDNRTKLIGEGLAQTGNIQLDHSIDGLEFDTVRFPHDRQNKHMNLIDEAVVDSASSFIRKAAPDLSWVYLEYTDDMGHMFGDGPEYFNAIDLMDKQMQRLWEAIQFREKNFNEDWLIVITTDHGRDSVTGRNHGGQSDRERLGWIATNSRNVNNYFKKGNPSIVDIMPTIASFLDIKIPEADLAEIDGILLTGDLGASNPKAKYKNGKITVEWKKEMDTGNVRISLATTNNYKTGGRDVFKHMITVPLNKEKAVIDVRKIPSNFYKIGIETPANYLNRWIIIDTKKAKVSKY